VISALGVLFGIDQILHQTLYNELAKTSLPKTSLTKTSLKAIIPRTPT